jgi:hypothetical protein
MIQRDALMPLLLQACPSFSDKWQAYRASWGEDEPLLYVDLGEFASHLVSLVQEKTINELADVFAVVEHLLHEGNHDVQEAVTVGLLEDVQNFAGHRKIDHALFRPFLEPETAYWWQRVQDFWNGKIPYIFDDRKEDA